MIDPNDENLVGPPNDPKASVLTTVMKGIKYDGPLRRSKDGFNSTVHSIDRSWWVLLWFFLFFILFFVLKVYIQAADRHPAYSQTRPTTPSTLSAYFIYNAHESCSVGTPSQKSSGELFFCTKFFLVEYSALHYTQGLISLYSFGSAIPTLTFFSHFQRWRFRTRAVK